MNEMNDLKRSYRCTVKLSEEENKQLEFLRSMQTKSNPKEIDEDYYRAEDQANVMEKYLHILKTRAVIENVDLNTEI